MVTAMSELTLTFSPTLGRRLQEAADRAGLSVPAYVTGALANMLQVCPVCGHEGPGVRVLSFDGTDGTCACPLTADEERHLESLIAQGR